MTFFPDLSGIYSGILSIFWHSFWHTLANHIAFWHIFWHSFWQPPADILAFILKFYLTYFRHSTIPSAASSSIFPGTLTYLTWHSIWHGILSCKHPDIQLAILSPCAMMGICDATKTFWCSATQRWRGLHHWMFYTFRRYMPQSSDPASSKSMAVTARMCPSNFCTWSCWATRPLTWWKRSLSKHQRHKGWPSSLIQLKIINQF